jgi:hypothetical protein
MNRAKVRALHEAVNEALKQVASEHGVGYVEGRGSYTDKDVSFKVGFADIAEDGTVQSREAQDYEQLHEGLHLPPLGTVVRGWGGDEYKIIGWRSRARKNPVMAEKVGNGKRYVFPADQIRAMVERAKK